MRRPGVLAVPADLLPVRHRAADGQQGLRRRQAGAGPARDRRSGGSGRVLRSAGAHQRCARRSRRSSRCAGVPVVRRAVGARCRSGVLRVRRLSRSLDCGPAPASRLVPEDVEYAETHLPTMVVASIGFMAIRAAVGFFVFTLAFTLRRNSEPTVGLRRGGRRLRLRRVHGQRDHAVAAQALPGADPPDDGHRRTGIAGPCRRARHGTTIAARSRGTRRAVDHARPPRVRCPAADPRSGGVARPRRGTLRDPVLDRLRRRSRGGHADPPARLRQHGRAQPDLHPDAADLHPFVRRGPPVGATRRRGVTAIRRSFACRRPRDWRKPATCGPRSSNPSPPSTWPSSPTSPSAGRRSAPSSTGCASPRSGPTGGSATPMPSGRSRSTRTLLTRKVVRTTT